MTIFRVVTLSAIVAGLSLGIVCRASDGVIELRRIRAAVEDAGYSGLIEAEIFSDRWWAEPLDTVLSTCVERYRTVV